MSAGAKHGVALCVGRGLRGRCPACGEGRVFGRYLKVAPACTACGLDLSQHRADDLPPYLVIFLVGHLVGGMVLETETRLDVPLWLSMTLWPLVTLGLALALLQPVKGGVVGLQYALGMHGFAAVRRGTGEAQNQAPEAGGRGRDGRGAEGTGDDHGPDGAAHLGRA